MTLSLNEVEALAKKATRGAGYPWGIAEEAGKAVRWLCAMNFDGCAALADLLVDCEGDNLSDRTPVLGNVWASRGGRLCPLLTGATLSDLADVLTGEELRLENVARPILLAPFASLAARTLEAPICLDWDNTRISTDGAAIATEGDTGAAVADVTIYVADGFNPAEAQAACSRAKPDAMTLDTLNRLAHRTYAPATEASRLSGAGAGLSDND